jgi:hypothetical protein
MSFPTCHLHLFLLTPNLGGTGSGAVTFSTCEQYFSLGGDNTDTVQCLWIRCCKGAVPFPTWAISPNNIDARSMQQHRTGEEKVRSTAKGVAITSIQQAMQVVHQFIQYSSHHDSLAVVTGHI